MKKEPLNKNIAIKVTEVMHQRLRELADENNQHVAEYVREVLNNHLNNIGE